jgi:hypothetical protein
MSNSEGPPPSSEVTKTVGESAHAIYRLSIGASVMILSEPNNVNAYTFLDSRARVKLTRTASRKTPVTCVTGVWAFVKSR